MTQTRVINLSVFFFTFIFINISCSQGCSDAGVCSATQYTNHTNSQESIHSFTYTQSVGLGDKNVLIVGGVFSYRIQALKNISLGISLPYSLTSGNLGTTYGIGDIIINANSRLYHSQKNDIYLFIAGKIASNNANKHLENQPLPMAYQQSSGTNDFIVAINWSHGDWFFASGYQTALNANGNEFLASNFPKGSLAESYHSSAYLKRGDDIMIRAQKIFNLKSGSRIKAGILPIFRIQEDEIKVNNVYEKVEKSSGLTLNLYLGWMHKITEKISGELQLAAPPITREVRVDGTTRTFVVNYIFKF